MTAPNDHTDSARAADGSQEQANANAVDVARAAFKACYSVTDLGAITRNAWEVERTATEYIRALEADRARLQAKVDELSAALETAIRQRNAYAGIVSDVIIGMKYGGMPDSDDLQTMAAEVTASADTSANDSTRTPDAGGEAE